ncbi:MAG: hypothetical protein ACYDCX_08100 [Acidithiobacillus sp.]
MKKSALLVSAISLAFAGSAFAWSTPPAVHASSDKTTTGKVSGNSLNTFSGNSQYGNSQTNIGSDAAINGSAFRNAAGVISGNQNSGANSEASNQTNIQVNTVAGVLDTSAKTKGLGEVGSNTAEVGTIGATINYDGNSYMGDNAFSYASGIISVNQNSGANSLLQNQTNVQVNQLSQACANGHCFGGTAYSSAALKGMVKGNSLTVYTNPSNYYYYNGKPMTNYNANATINGAAFSNASGIISASQNSGANSLLQNQTVVQVSTLGKSTGHLSDTLGGAVTGNMLKVTATGNPSNPYQFSQTNYAANATIGGTAFSNAAGVISVNQNTGANSMLQNQTSIQVNK